MKQWRSFRGALALRSAVADCRRGVSEACDRLGGLDILINNASAISKTPALETEAKRLGVSIEDLARAAVTDLLAAPDAAFQAAAQRVLAQNLELYRRLA